MLSIALVLTEMPLAASAAERNPETEQAAEIQETHSEYDAEPKSTEPAITESRTEENKN